MKINENNFYPNNFEDFVHKNVLQHLFKRVAEIEISDHPDLESILGMSYQRDDNGEYRLLMTYVDRNGKTQQQVINPAITSRAIELANSELVKHFLYVKNGADISINQMKFIDDKLRLSLVDGDQIELDLKPLVPRVNVIGPNGEVLQKNLNYHINDNAIVFVDMQGNETVLDFKKLLTVKAFNQFQDENAVALQKLSDEKVNKADYQSDQVDITNNIDSKVSKTDFENYQTQTQNKLDQKENTVDADEKLAKKVDKTDYNKFVDDTRSELDTKADKVKMAAALSKKEDIIDHDNDIQHLQTQINDRSTHAETDQAITETIKQIKEWANPVHEQLLNQFKDYVTKTIFDNLAQKVDDLQTTKLNVSDFEKEKENLVKAAELTDYVTKQLLSETLTNYDTTTVIDDKLDQKADKEATQTALNSKANASDVAADFDQRYTKEEVNALLSQKADKETTQTALNSKANASDVQADFDKRYTKEEVDALLSTAISNIQQYAFMPYVSADGNWHVKKVVINPDGTVSDVTA